MAQINIVAIISPKAGKVDRLLELVSQVCQYVKDNEPGTLRYEATCEVNKQSGVEQIIMFETYKDKEALKAHGSSEKFKGFQKMVQDEDLLSEPLLLKFVKPAGGFSSRL
ncbi:antibiotic biosynthesis monooxygenase protein [Rutstroemia sp. NJR-2017a BBW]|nr:antibiotic biosynthesis monooxygenase protein [Rutstroemia sp. NJR-2017a BBW]